MATTSPACAPKQRPPATAPNAARPTTARPCNTPTPRVGAWTVLLAVLASPIIAGMLAVGGFVLIMFHPLAGAAVLLSCTALAAALDAPLAAALSRKRWHADRRGPVDRYRFVRDPRGWATLAGLVGVQAFLALVAVAAMILWFHQWANGFN